MKAYFSRGLVDENISEKSVCGIGSTGRICTDLADALVSHGNEVRIAYGREEVPEQYQKYAVRIGTDLDVKFHFLKARLFDSSGFGSKYVTKKFIEWIKEYNPDVIHLHNIHGYYLNIEVLFNYLSTCGKKIIWTLHDCWAFTGHAAYCEAASCTKWKSGCSKCPNKSDYPKSMLDNSSNNWRKKKELFAGIQNLQLISPSNWLKNLVEESYLSEYPISVIHNGIDTSVFKPTKCIELRQELNLGNKKVILGVASTWDERKGLGDLIKLAGILDDDYQVVLIGVTRKQKKQLPNNVIGITRTNSPNVLVELYSWRQLMLIRHTKIINQPQIWRRLPVVRRF